MVLAAGTHEHLQSLRRQRASQRYTAGSGSLGVIGGRPAAACAATAGASGSGSGSGAGAGFDGNEACLFSRSFSAVIAASCARSSAISSTSASAAAVLGDPPDDPDACLLTKTHIRHPKQAGHSRVFGAFRDWVGPHRQRSAPVALTACASNSFSPAIHLAKMPDTSSWRASS